MQLIAKNFGRTQPVRDDVESRNTETVWDLIETQARTHPRQTAIIDGETEIDYERLTARAGAIAGELVARGVEPGSLVGVCMGRTWELVAALVGVLRAGCAYVPLDPAYPQERVDFMLEHSGAAIAVVDGEATAALCQGVPELLRLDEVRPAMAADGVIGPSATDLAYVLYTSGSTGRPKGVAVEHRNVVAMSRSVRAMLKDEELEGVLAAASICFDASVKEILGTLSLGGTIILADNVLALLDLPAAERVRMCVTVPSVMQALLVAGRLPRGMRCVALGGEVLKRSLVRQLHASESGPRVLNLYGPTEATVFVTSTEVSAGSATVTIGKPVAGSGTYILDDAMQPVGPGTAGELYLAGDQLARGYLYEEELTAQRFISLDSAGSIPEQRLYRTGDLCRWTEHGDIEFLGRLDQQVKVRGFRIELEEIESVLETMPGVEVAAAVVVNGAGDRKMLVAYVVSRQETLTSQEAREHLATRLPDYMVPGVVMQVEELPRLPNGKLDRKALPVPELTRPPCRLEVCVPRSSADAGGEAGALEQRLAGLSRDERHSVVLSILRAEIASMLRLQDPEIVQPFDSLQDLGFDSLTTVELGSRMATLIDRKLPASAVLERSTPAALADYVLDQFGNAIGQDSTVSAKGEASDTLGSLQTQIQTCYPPFMAAKASSWSATDKGMLVQELKRLVGGAGQDPFSKMVRTGSGDRGIVADVHTREEREAIIWSTNLYLGLNRDPGVIEEARAALERLGTGMGTSAAAAGVTDLHLEFEEEFAELVGKPAACLFPTGYTANVGAVAGLLGKNDVVVLDQLCHASIVDGARLCGAKIRTFQHNSSSDLESVLQAEASPYRTILVVLEGAYSMGEGAAPIAKIARTAKKYDALVLVDEAHSFGFYGPRGAGLCAEQGATDHVDFIMTTLSKALGSLGGVVAARKEHVALLKSSSRAYIFQASTSPADMAAALAALRRLRADDALRKRLWDTTAYMRKRFSEAGYDLGSGDGPIVTPFFPDKEKLFKVVEGLFERGVCASAVTYPIVESGRGRLRFICSASHTREDVDKTLEALIDADRAAEKGADRGVDRGTRKGTAQPRQAADEGPSALRPPSSDLQEWADDFCAYLKETASREPGRSPKLAVSVGLSDASSAAGQTMTIVVDGGDITVRDHAPGANVDSETNHLPTCSLRLEGHRAVSALCSSDVQSLLDSVVQGTCVLSGQVEPFIWLVARMAECPLPVSEGSRVLAVA